MSRRPATPDTAVVKEIEVLLVLVIAVAATPPTVTDVAFSRFVPETVTRVPPATGPTFGVTVEIVGASIYRNVPLTVAVPPKAVVKANDESPAVPAGMVKVTWVELRTVTSVAAVPPIVTPVVLNRLTPVSVTVPPPAARLTVGVKDVIVGGVA